MSDGDTDFRKEYAGLARALGLLALNAADEDMKPAARELSSQAFRVLQGCNPSPLHSITNLIEGRPMSYDVSNGIESYNYTYNLSKFFHKYIEHDTRTGLQTFQGLNGTQVIEILDKSFTRIGEDVAAKGFLAFCEEFDAPNGWGKTAGAFGMLVNIYCESGMNPSMEWSVG